MAFTLQPVVTAQDVEQTAQMADAIWHEYFTPIIGAEQVAYMLEKFQCVAAMQRQISQENMQYFRLMRDGVMVGYTGIREEPDALFLSKLYLAKEYRGQGLARQTLNALVQRCRRQGLSKIWLTVNRYNARLLRRIRRWDLSRCRSSAPTLAAAFIWMILLWKSRSILTKPNMDTAAGCRKVPAVFASHTFFSKKVLYYIG